MAKLSDIIAARKKSDTETLRDSLHGSSADQLLRSVQATSAMAVLEADLKRREAMLAYQTNPLHEFMTLARQFDNPLVEAAKQAARLQDMLKPSPMFELEKQVREQMRFAEEIKRMVSPLDSIQEMLKPIRQLTDPIRDITRYLQPFPNPAQEILEQTRKIQEMYRAQEELALWKSMSFADIGRATSFNWIAPTLDRAFDISSRIFRRYAPPVDYRHILCASALEDVEDNDQAEVVIFTVNVLGLAPGAWSYAAEVLVCGAWRDSLDPVLFIRTETKRMMARESRAGFSRYFLFVPLDSSGLILSDPNSCAGFERSELFLDAVSRCRHAGFQGEEAKDAAMLLLARSFGVTRQRAGQILGWTSQKVEAIWRALSRAKDRKRS